MKKFLLKSTLFIVLILSSIFTVIYLLPVGGNKYLAASLDKQRLLEKTPQPRLILVGDSNIAFGVDSAMIRRETGYNVVNMGLHGGLSLIYYMDELKPHLKKNDIVIFILDYQNFYGDGSGTNTIVEITIFNPKIIRYYSPKNLYNYVINIPLAFQRRLKGAFSKTVDDPAMVRSGFNEYGDNIAHLSLPQPIVVAPPRRVPRRINDDTVRLFREFYDRWHPAGVRIYLSFSPLLEQDRAQQLDDLAALMADFHERLGMMRLIGRPEEFIYPSAYFYDNIFHLNGRGREIHTRDLITAMKRIPELAAAPRR